LEVDVEAEVAGDADDRGGGGAVVAGHAAGVAAGAVAGAGGGGHGVVLLSCVAVCAYYATPFASAQPPAEASSPRPGGWSAPVVVHQDVEAVVGALDLLIPADDEAGSSVVAVDAGVGSTRREEELEAVLVI